MLKTLLTVSFCFGLVACGTDERPRDWWTPPSRSEPYPPTPPEDINLQTAVDSPRLTEAPNPADDLHANYCRMIRPGEDQYIAGLCDGQYMRCTHDQCEEEHQKCCAEADKNGLWDQGWACNLYSHLPFARNYPAVKPRCRDLQ